MDAWLKPYINDPRGTSILIVRNSELNRVLQEEMGAGHILLNTINEEDVINSQKGALDFKKENINKKKTFLFNKWLSNKFYTGNAFSKTLGVNVLKIQILLLKKYKQIKKHISNSIRKWGVT